MKEKMYKQELIALKKSNRFRQRFLISDSIVDFASNDYLGIAENEAILDQTYHALKTYKSHAPKASMLVNGYHQIHKNFENALCKANNFESGIIMGSGFLANISIIEALVRKEDILFIDEEYHASGMLATKLHRKDQVVIFKHNEPTDLIQQLETRKCKGRIIIAVEGIYSMSGDTVAKEIFRIADDFDALLIVDEAHSSGIVGKSLMGVFELFSILPKQNHIKMGTLGKAYGSYGAYILASNEIISFLENRAKAIIYSTAPSLFESLAGNFGLQYILDNQQILREKIKNVQSQFQQQFALEKQGLIFPFQVHNNTHALTIKESLLKQGFVVGAIRKPTVTKPILRVIGRINIDHDTYKEFFDVLKKSLF